MTHLFTLVAQPFVASQISLANMYSDCVNIKLERVNVCDARMEDSPALFLDTNNSCSTTSNELMKSARALRATCYLIAPTPSQQTHGRESFRPVTCNELIYVCKEAL